MIAGRATWQGTDDVARRCSPRFPGPFGEAREVAAAIGFLASPAGGFITGVSLRLTAGGSVRYDPRRPS